MFRRTLAAVHLTAEDVRWMVGAWRERLVVCTGRQGPPAAVVKAFVDAGAKAIIVSAEETDRQGSSGRGGEQGGGAVGAADGGEGRGGRLAADEARAQAQASFVIGEDEEGESGSSTESSSSSSGGKDEESDWEDSEAGERTEEGRQARDEQDVAAFVGVLYDALLRQGLGAEAALQQALEAHPKQHYKCVRPPF